MIVINKIQKIVYETLKSNITEVNGIFTYIEKNEELPYIFLHIDNVCDLSTFSKNIYSYTLAIDIFDQNTTNGFVMGVSEKVKALFANIGNFDNVDCKIIDIKFKNFEISLNNDGKIWNGRLLFELIAEI